MSGQALLETKMSQLHHRDDRDRLPAIPGAVPKASSRDPWAHVKSKCNSLSNVGHKPGGGHREISTLKCHWNADARVGSLINVRYSPHGGNKKVVSMKLVWHAAPKVGSLENRGHAPGGGDRKIETRKCIWHAEAKIGSLANAKHVPGGGNVKIEQHKLNFKENALPKIAFRSHNNTIGKPGGIDGAATQHKSQA